jgi:hypothetical protein
LQLFLLFSISSQIISQTVYGSNFSFDCNDNFETLSANSVSAINNQGLNLQNKKIMINGTFVVDRDLAFVNCKIKMGPDAVIITDGNVKFNAVWTVFAGCTSPWSRIAIKPGATIRFTTCLIRDAKDSGINFTQGYAPQNGSPSWIRNCVFVNDNIGIQALGGFPINLGALSFSGNRFLSEENNFTPTNVPSITMRIGVNLNNCNGQIGSTGAVNVFNHSESNTECGIMINNSSVRISNCEFIGFQNGPVNSETTGCGILATGSVLYVEKTGAFNKCIFRNSYRGIVTRTSRKVSIKGAEFYDTQNDYFRKGIICLSPQASSRIEVNDNFISLTRPISAIDVRRPSAPLSSDSISTINNNKLYIGGIQAGSTSHTGIFVAGNNNSFNKMLIRNNEVHFITGCRDCNGIEIVGANMTKGYKIQNNKVYYEGDLLPGNSSAWGIALEASDSGEPLGSELAHEISDNVVDITDYQTGTGFSRLVNSCSPVQCGIHVRACPNLTVRNNKVGNAFRNFHMQNNNNNCDFSCNEMNGGYYGLSCNNSDLSDQNFKNNKWLVGHEQADASLWLWFNNGNTPIDQNPVYFFRADQTNPILFPDVIEPTTWFLDNNTPARVCGSQFVTPTNPNGDIRNHFSSFQSNVILGTGNPGWTDVKLWDEKRLIHQTLLRNPNISQTIPAVNTWKISQNNTSAQLFAQAEVGMFGLAAPSAAMAAQIQQYYRQIDAYFAIFSNLSTVLEAGTPDSTAVGIQLNMYSDSLALVNKLLLGALEDIQTTKINASHDYEGKILQLPDTTPQEQLRKEFLLLRLQQLKSDTFTQKEINRLAEIADSCYSVYGETVLEVPRLLPYEMGARYIHNEYPIDNCVEERGVVIEEPSQINVAPNPASEVLNIHAASHKPILRWEIFSQLGKMQQSGEPNAAQFSIDIRNIPTGTWYIKCHTDENAVSTTKFIIIR